MIAPALHIQKIRAAPGAWPGGGGMARAAPYLVKKWKNGVLVFPDVIAYLYVFIGQINALIRIHIIEISIVDN